MDEIRSFLDLPEDATLIQIRQAYHRKREVLLKDNDANASEQLRWLDDVMSHAIQQSAPSEGKSLNESETEMPTALVATPERNLSLPITPNTTTTENDPATYLARTMQEEPLRAPVKMVACPYCGNQTPAMISSCTHCGQQATKPCPVCGQPVLANERFCPRCSTPQREYDAKRFAEAETVIKQVQLERMDNEVHVQTLETTHRKKAVHGAFFWLIVFAVVVGLCVLAAFVYQMASQG